jgi:hypothetical protein
LSIFFFGGGTGKKIDKLSEENTELDGWRRWGEMDGDGGERWMETVGRD